MSFLQNARAVVKTFGQRVRAHRTAAGLSQPDLGKLARVSDRFIGEIERGETNPSLITMVLIADALNCPLSELLSPETSPHVTFKAEDIQRAQEAAAVLGAILSPRRRPRGPS